ncbi:hypothetical protein EUTSA_v10012066mg [Eutrema salsugineum]|uniref:YDG domain-containing protein n=1 Tax=Eutrema salsugineum TaxID=72664 RepID=V4KHR7_EUTSA|nr:hypothetical protein EUTSA_v10012066mg [Eutrema salsugineum]
MIQLECPLNKKQKVSVIRDFPHGCGTQYSVKNQRCGVGSEAVAVTIEKRENLNVSEVVGVAYQNNHHKEVESVDMKKAGFSVVSNGSVGSRSFVSAKRKFSSCRGSKVKLLSMEESIELIDSQRTRGQVSYTSRSNQRKPLQKQKNSLKKNKKKKILSNGDAFRAKTHKQTQDRQPNKLTGLNQAMQQNRINKVLSPREKVLEVLHRYQLVFNELDREKAERSGEPKIARSQIDLKTRAILIKEGEQVNSQKMIGPVPGIEVGDEFEYKSVLSLIGLHFDLMGGIDYMCRGNLKLATSIVSSEDNGYNDRFVSDVIIYTGEGGYMMTKDHEVVKDQQLVNGNEALANSMKEKTPVRLIRGEKRLKQSGKKVYVYDGLYWVNDYWKEREVKGNIVFKFKLCRISGQPHVHLKHRCEMKRVSSG